MRITLETSFDAAHRLPFYEGNCNRMHGHTYKVLVTICGPVIENGAQTGMVIDFHELKALMKNIFTPLDHYCLNDTVPNPTAENLAIYLGLRVREELEDVMPWFPAQWDNESSWSWVEVTVYESPVACATVKISSGGEFLE